MDFNIIFISSRSVTLELVNDLSYYNDELYEVYVNDELYASKVNTNIFSIYGLESDKDYKITLKGSEDCEKIVHTKYELVTLNVKRFGAKGDLKHDDTMFIQAAINACPREGRVLIPEGEYLVRPLFLKSNITIELAKGARLVGDTNRENYPILPGMVYTSDEKDEFNLGSWEGNPLDCFASIITGIGVKNVKIIGEGIIDGNAQNSDWWVDVRVKRIAWRPRGVFLVRCKDIEFEGVTVTNTPSWNLHPYFSENIRFIDMKIINPKDSPNTDGCDPESCKNVDIIGLYFSVGDDCIAIKSGKIYMGKKYLKPSEKFNIRNCSMNFGHGGIVLGSEMSAGIKDLVISRCVFNQTDRGIRIKTRRGRGKDCIIDNITFENVQMIDVLTPFVMNMFYFCDPDGKTDYVSLKTPMPVDDRTPYLGNFYFRNMTCEGVSIAAGAFYGLPEQPIEGVTMENVTFKYTKNPKEGVPAMMREISPMSKKGLIFENVKEVNLTNVKFLDRIDEEVEIVGSTNLTRN